jgi:hypothetical protein
MTHRTNATAARLAITTYCAWHARDLLAAWDHNLYDRYGWLVLLAWCLPLFISIPAGREEATARRPAITLMLSALLSTLVGLAGSLNVLQHIGLALALASWVPFSPLHLLWLLAAICWMPAFGWIGSRLFAEHILPARVLLVVTFSGGFAANRVNSRRGHP